MSRIIIIVVMVVSLFVCMVGAAYAASDRYSVSDVSSCTLAGSRARCFTLNTVDETDHITTSVAAYAGDGILDTKIVNGWVTTVSFPGWFPWQGGSLTQADSQIGWRYQ